ncbi:MAG TPA: biotin/lipoyl-containing protein [Dehalococcoidia bacterium]|nr:biotin/lipoyl-containing protein [Dehalococcoidia bacterium]
MKRRFKITLEGETYEVDVEEVVEGRVPPPMANVPPVPMINKPTEALPKPPEAPPLASQPPVPRILDEGVVPSPMQGRVGDTVKAGGVLILEAMKMESDIRSPKDGKIKEIHVSEGGYVKKGEPMVSIEG